MRVIEITEPGAPEVLHPAERPDPRTGEGRVRVRVHASGVNRADLLQRLGRYPSPPGWPEDIPGLEFSGVVEEVGDGCHLRKVGDPVMGILGGGGYADTVVVQERETIRVPEGIDVQTAGAIPEVFITAWDAVVRRAGLRSGERLLVHAVGSGVGTAGVQLGTALGARVIGTSRTAEKVERASALGLGAGIVVSDPDGWAEEVLARTENAGVDVILDLVGAAYLKGNLACLAEGARWIVVGVPGGMRGEIDLRRLMARRASLMGTVLRARPPEEKALLAREFERTVVPLFESGALHPIVDRTMPAEHAAEAHRRMEDNATYGKVLLTWT